MQLDIFEKKAKNVASTLQITSCTCRYKQYGGTLTSTAGTASSAGFCRFLQVFAGFCRFLQVFAGFCRFLQVFAGWLLQVFAGLVQSERGSEEQDQW